MILQGFVYLFVLYLLESVNCRRVVRAMMVRPQGDNTLHRQEANAEIIPLVPVSAEEGDVAAERQRITNTPIEQLRNTDIVILRQLKKVYRNRLPCLIYSQIQTCGSATFKQFYKTILFSLCDQRQRSHLM